MIARPSSAFLLLLAGAVLASGLAAVHAVVERHRRLSGREARGALVRELGLTDLCLFTEARYTRHPSQADRFTPFQDSPGSPEHFPSGSMAAPPPAP